MSTNGSKAIVAPKNKKTLVVLGEPVTTILSGEDTDGQYALVESITPPGGGVPFLHTHPVQETFWIIEGEYEIYGLDAAGNKYATPARVGDAVHVPHNSPHGFRNVGQTPGKLLFIFEPAGNMEVFFEEVGLPIADQTLEEPPNPEKLTQALQKYNIVFLETPPAE
ncbi:MAG: cupin domain-containing protein [Anaerolineae bacterium]|nr:cupin domain-containing protein [Anaerolineae bacterium]